MNEMWWAGIPPAVRGQIWKLCVGNELRITPGLFYCYAMWVKDVRGRVRGGRGIGGKVKIYTKREGLLAAPHTLTHST